MGANKRALLACVYDEKGVFICILMIIQYVIMASVQLIWKMLAMQGVALL
jgi:hypothetical protein